MPMRVRQLIIGVMTIAWLIVIAGLTVIRYAPAYLNADVILNSVMSLQRITLFYWGQNRLLSVLPMLVYPFRDPAWNLGAVLLITSLSFYGLLYVISWWVVHISNDSIVDRPGLILKVFIAVSIYTLIVFKPISIFEMAIGHIEYSGALLLLALAAYMLLKARGRSMASFAVGVMALFIAMGMNPSIVIPMTFLVTALPFYRQAIRKTDIVVGLASLLIFVLWAIVSSSFGKTTYGKFDVSRWLIGLNRSMKNISSTVEPVVLLLSILLFILAWVAASYVKKRKPRWSLEEGFILFFGLLFSIVWLMVFSMSSWVAANKYHWRYFSFIIFAGILFVAISVRKLIENVNNWLSSIVVAACTVVAVGTLYPGVKPFSGYPLFRQVDRFSKPGAALYAGNYWKVWPSVMRDMMAGHEAYGLTFRGDANAEAAAEFVMRNIDLKGEARVLCVEAKPESCLQSIKTIVGPVEGRVMKDADQGLVIVLRRRGSVMPDQ